MSIDMRSFQPHHDGTSEARLIEGYGPLLFDALFDGGPPAVIAIMRELYSLETA